MYIYLILTALLHEECWGALIEKIGSKFQIVKGSGKNCTVVNIPREDDLEYPRMNEEIRKKVEEMWNTYYKCLNEKAKEERKPELIRLLEGQFIQLNCDICVRPFQDYNVLDWKYKPLNPDEDIRELDYLDLTPEMELTQNKSLKMYNVFKEFAGIYACFQGKNAISVYIIEIASNDTVLKVTSSYYGGESFIHLKGVDLEIDHSWSEWTKCSSCGVVGRQYKYGNCRISAKQNSEEGTSIVRQRIFKRNASELIKEKVEKIKETFKRTKSNEKSLDTSENLSWINKTINSFKNGIPCFSSFIPKELLPHTQNLTSIRVVFRYCSVNCQEPEVFEVVDPDGKVIEKANNSAGIYSVFQSLPQLPSEIQRQPIGAEHGKDIVIQCPSSLLENTPITWKVNDKILFPKLIANESNNRITIDYVQRIHIKGLKHKDSNIYSCWQRDKLIGTVTLHVDRRYKIAVNHHLILFGMIAIVGTFLFVGMKVLSKELKCRQK